MSLQQGERLRIHFLQHVSSETPGNITAWALENGHETSCTLFHEGDQLPVVSSLDWLVIMGGPMGVHDEQPFPWLADEKAFIKKAIDSGKIVLGFCLGSQLIADVLGGKVTTNQFPEIGWHPVRWTDAARSDPRFAFFPESTPVFQWHFDTFSELPPGARLLATSEACRHQAFVHNDRVFGFQFHLENTSEMIIGMALDLPMECGRGQWVQSADEMTSRPDLVAKNDRWLRELLDRIASGT